MDPSTATLIASKRRELLSFDSQKKAIESEAEAIVSELTAPLPDGGPPIGIDTPLVDSEGYPRADIDVFRARTLRKRFIELQTDYKVLQGKIEKGLVEVQALSKSTKEDESEHALRSAPKPKPKFDPITGQWVVKSWDGSVAGVKDGESRRFDDLMAGVSGNVEAGTASTVNDTLAAANNVPNGNTTTETALNNNTAGTTPEQQIQILEPFALIDEVFSSSPASTAGIKVGDILLKFDSIDSTNHENFTAIAKLLPKAAQEGKGVDIKVRRKKEMEWGEVWEVKEIKLFPKVWDGRGLLGCHITKYDGE